mgnify:FL=1
MHNAHDPKVLPIRDGVSPSCVVLPSQGGGLLIDFLAERLPAVAREDWLRRLALREVVDEHGRAADAGTAFAPGLRYYYYRELQAEPPIPFEAEVLHRDAHLLVADKPHFLSLIHI